MELKKTTKRNFKTFDQAEAISNAQKVIDKLKLKHCNMQSFKIDRETTVQIAANRKNVKQIVDRVKNKKPTITLIEQLEYGQYA